MTAAVNSATARRQSILDEIAFAARISRRNPDQIRLIGISKGRTAEEIEPLIIAGQRDFGENRVQEAEAKWPALIARYPDVRLHAIGRLQSNKAADAASLFDTIHSLDRVSLLEALAKATTPRPAYIQVNIGEEEQKGGCAIADLPALIDAVRASPLPLLGLMAIPPLGLDPAPFFALLAKLAHSHDVTGLSMGMSADYKTAVMLGETAVRVGTALFED